MKTTTRVTKSRTILLQSKKQQGSSSLPVPLLLLLLVLLFVSNISVTIANPDDHSNNSVESTTTTATTTTTLSSSTIMTNNSNESEEKDIIMDHHSPLKKKKILVVGATGNTGKHVVQFLLDQGHFVSVIARSKEKVWAVLPGGSSSSSITMKQQQQQLTVIEASMLDLTDDELKTYTTDVDAVVSCLGHAGVYSEPRRLVRDAVMRLTTVMPKTSKFILMSSSGCAHPNIDPIRSLSDRILLFLIRNLVPPHADNEEAALYLYNQKESIPNWVVVRPTDLIDSNHVSGYDTYETPQDSLFSGEYTATRINVAHFMVELILNDTTFNKWNQKMPVFYDKKKTTTTTMTTKAEEEDQAPGGGPVSEDL